MRDVTIKEIEDFLISHRYSFNSTIEDKTLVVKGYSSLKNYKEGTLTWVKSSDNIAGKEIGGLSFIIAQTGIDIPSKRVIYCDESKAAFFGIIDELLDQSNYKNVVGAYSDISESVNMGEDVIIGSNCVLDGEITIGDRTIIMDGTVIINRCEIGHDTIIQPLCVIGIDGFGYYTDENA